MAALTTTVIPLQGSQLDAALVAASAGGDTAQTGAGVFLAVKNADASSHTVTLATPGTLDGDLAVADRAVVVAAGKTELIPLTSRYRDPATGRAAITYDAVTSVTVAPFRVDVSS
jgi:type IV secretory pathway TraG/TraD family ATPase VirD4